MLTFLCAVIRASDYEPNWLSGIARFAQQQYNNNNNDSTEKAKTKREIFTVLT